MSLMGIITGGMSDIAKSKQEKDSMDQARATQREGELYQRGLDQQTRDMYRPFYDLGLPAYKSYASAVTGGIDPNTGHTWTPTDSPAYQWQMDQANKATSRSLRALGRQNSTFGMNTIADSNRNLASKEWDSQIGRLADLSNIARGGASSLAGINSQMGVNGINSANNQANYLLGLSQLKSQGIGEFDKGIGQAAGIVGSLYGGGLFGGKKGA